MGSQYHFHMETQTCIVSPTEEGFDIEIASQDINVTQKQLAKVLNMSNNRLDARS